MGIQENASLHCAMTNCSLMEFSGAGAKEINSKVPSTLSCLYVKRAMMLKEREKGKRGKLLQGGEPFIPCTPPESEVLSTSLFHFTPLSFSKLQSLLVIFLQILLMGRDKGSIRGASNYYFHIYQYIPLLHRINNERVV